MQHRPFEGIVAATHTPFAADGSLCLATVEKQASHLLENRVQAVFIGGSTGESHSLSLDERRQLTVRWLEVAQGTSLRVIVHVGSNCLRDAVDLAAHAAAQGAAAVSALAPCYFKPRNLDDLVDWCRAIAVAAPATSFYFYDIPVLTGVNMSMPELLEKVQGQIATFVGIKFTSSNLMAFQECRRVRGGEFEILWGIDEYLLAAVAVGARGGVGSTYNFAAPLYHRLLAKFAGGDLAGAREEQYRSVQLVRLLAGYGYMGAAKAVMGMLGIHVGPARLPNGNPTPEQTVRLRKELEQLGFFEWVKA